MPSSELVALVSLLVTTVAAARFIWLNHTNQPVQPRHPAPDSMHYKLKLLDINLAPFFLYVGIVLLSLCAFLLITISFPDQRAVAIIAAGAVMLGSYFILNDLVGWRIKQLEYQLIDAMDTMHSAMQAGLPINQAIATANTLTKGSLKLELAEVIRRLKLGYDDTTAMNRLLTRYNCEGTRLFAQTFIARQQTGSNIHATLQAVTLLLRQRQQQYQQVASKLSGTRYAAIFCGAMPYVLIPLFLAEQPDWFTPLLQHPKGATYISTALILQLLGFIGLRKVLRTTV